MEYKSLKLEGSPVYFNMQYGIFLAEVMGYFTEMNGHEMDAEPYHY